MLCNSPTITPTNHTRVCTLGHRSHGLRNEALGMIWHTIFITKSWPGYSLAKGMSATAYFWVLVHEISNHSCTNIHIHFHTPHAQLKYLTFTCSSSCQSSCLHIWLCNVVHTSSRKPQISCSLIPNSVQCG